MAGYDLSGNPQTVTITAANQFTTPMAIQGCFNGQAFGSSVPGAIVNNMVGTITLQRSEDYVPPVSSTGIGGPSAAEIAAAVAAATWEDVNSWTSPMAINDEDDVGAWYRIGCKAGQYTSGTCVCRLTTK